MPVIRPRAAGSRVVPDRQALIRALVGELLEEARGEPPARRPVIFEMPAGKSGLVNVIVYWEAWRGLDSDARSAIIVEAYDRFAKALEQSIHVIDPGRPVAIAVPRSATAIGATWDDVVDLDLLPLLVQPSAVLSESDEYSSHRLMQERGAIETPGGLQLRFPSRQLAQDAVEALNRELPQAHWVIIEAGGAAGEPFSREFDA